MTPKYDVFISHAGEDKAALGVLIYEGLRRRGISAFLDERELLVAGDAVREMDEAMQTALVGLFILSPEFALKYYPMLEAECFLRRAGLLGDGSGSSEAIRPEIIPVFYRLPVGGCKYEGVFESMECEEAVRERFNERVERGETSLAKVLECLTLLSSRTGVENKSGIGNDATEEMKERRLELAEKICDAVTGVLMRRGREIEATSQSRRVEEYSQEELCATFDDPKNPPEVVMDFSGAMGDGEPQAVEAKVLREVMQNEGGRRIISLFGGGGVGKSCIVREVARQKIVRQRFPGGVYFMTLGMDGSVDTLRLELLRVLRNSGGENIAEKVHDEECMDVIFGEVGKVIGRGRSLVIVDDVWERNGISAKIASDVWNMLSSEHGGTVVVTTRHGNVASRGDVKIDIKPREAVSETTRNIILKYAKCDEEGVEKENAGWVVEKLQKIGGGLPVCLAVIGRGVGKLRVSVGEKGWEMYWERIRDRAETLLNAKVDDYEALNISLSISLEMLEKDEETGIEGLEYSWREMYGSLCVLTKQKLMRRCVLERMWNVKGKGDLEMVLAGFSSVGLGEIVFERGEMKGLKVHDLLHDFAISLVMSDEERVAWHRKLLDGYICSSEESAREWWRLDEDGYVFENLSRHLMEGGCTRELIRVLLRAEWTNTRLRVGGLNAWLKDFWYCFEGIKKNNESEKREETRSGLRMVRDAVCKFCNVKGVRNSTNKKKKESRVNRANLRLVRDAVCKCWTSAGFRKSENDNSKETVAGLRLVRDVVCKCWTLLGVNEREQLAFQIYGRLQEAKERPVRKYLESVKGWQRGMWLKPDRECWPRPGEELYEEIGLRGGWALSVILYGELLSAVVGTDRGELMVINAEERRIVKKWVGHESGVRRVGMSKEEGNIVSYSLDGTVRRWDMETGAQVRVTRLNGTEHSVTPQTVGWYLRYSQTSAFSSDCKMMLIGSDDGRVEVWDTETGERVGDLMHGFECAVHCVGMSPGGSQVVAGGEDGCVRMWDLATRAQLWAAADRHEQEVTCVAFSPDGRLVVSGSEDCTLQLWNARTGEQIGSPLRGHESGVMCVTFSHDSRTIVSGGQKGSVRMWNFENGEQVGQTLRGSSGFVFAVALSSDRRAGVSGGPDRVRIWYVMDAAVRDYHVSAYFSLVTCVAASVDKSFYVSGHVAYSPTTERSALRMWAAESGKQIRETLQLGVCADLSVSISPDDVHVVCGIHDGRMQVWGVRSRKQVGNDLCGHTGGVWAIAHSPDGRWIVSGSDDKTVRVWSAETHAQMSPSAGSVRKAGVTRRWGTDGAEIANNVNVGMENVYEHNCEVYCVRFSTDGRRIIFGGEDGKLYVWEKALDKRVYSANSEHADPVVRIDALGEDQVRSLDNAGQEMRWRLESGGGLMRTSEVGSDTQQELFEGEGIMVLPRGDEVVCFGHYVRRSTDGTVIVSLPAGLLTSSRTWHYDSSRGVVVTGLLDGRVIFSRFIV